MMVNRDKPDKWKVDIMHSVDVYNEWFMKCAPKAFRETRIQTTKDVEGALLVTSNLTDIQSTTIREHPGILPALRMSTCPPLAADRLIGLAKVSVNLVKSIEIDKRLPPNMATAEAETQLARIAAIIEKMADPDIFVWLRRENRRAGKTEIHRAATVVADRLCSAVANPIIRNAQERRQLAAIKEWLEARGYKQSPAAAIRFEAMPPGTFSLRMNVAAELQDGVRTVNIPVDVVIKPKKAKERDLPFLWEAKSAGDFTNTNKRRKEEAAKVSQLRATYGNGVQFNLFLCGYFDTGYLGYEAAEGIDWVWEHRIDDFAKFGI